ncbi:cytochrome d ubiquinol oxidase subunit II [Allonocardiopsis opalescens]|uniref:Cytochrome d oxidase subunit CydB n=1 Tax=Allonocardiopsis opalescens TaxID=1144618 RepID=A0A2T0QDK9_9ACTN|nr:cytochrome d ubiquinol oxidase subunit II [Allonocardiopsis opalescens]PRY02009.1 cytochrome d oxidase subunit CydB [Allonocardiopsis opalescens]
MEILWIAVFAVLVGGYFVLEGFTIGVGVLLPVVARTERERATAVAGIGPFFLGNEVWLVAVVGVLFGVFPELEGRLLAGLYPVVVLFLVAWVLRSAGLWMRARGESAAWRAVWDTAITAGSVLMAAMWGVALANAAAGLPAEPGTPMPGLLHPYALLGAVTMVAVLAAHGAAFLAGRVADTPGERAAKLLVRLPMAALAVLAVAALGAPMAGGRVDLWWIGAGAILMVAALATLRAAALVRGGGGGAFGYTAVAAAAPALAVVTGALGVLQAHAAPQPTLLVLTLTAGPVLPLLALAQVWLWRTFWGVVDRTTASYL